MSHKKSPRVSELIENVLKTDPNISRGSLGRLIRAENPDYQTASGRRRLDRALAKLYPSEAEVKRKLALALSETEKKQNAYYNHLDKMNRDKEANILKDQKLIAQTKDLLRD
jgi:hypothetical protein